MASMSMTQIRIGSFASGFCLNYGGTGRGHTHPSRVGFKVFASETQVAEPDPPGTNYTVMKRAFDEGWGAVIAKTGCNRSEFLVSSWHARTQNGCSCGSKIVDLWKRYSTPGGYSAKAVHPIALGKVMSIAKMMKSEFDCEDYSPSGIGGLENGADAAEFILLGENTVQAYK